MQDHQPCPFLTLSFCLHLNRFGLDRNIHRTAHARGKADAATTAAQKAQEESRLARITAKEFSPSFQHRGNSECNQPSLETKNNWDFKLFDSTTKLLRFTANAKYAN